MFQTSLTGVFHIGYKTYMTVIELAKFIFGEKFLESIGEAVFLPKRDFEAEDGISFGSMQNYKYGRITGLNRTIEWYRNEYSRT